MVDEYTRRYTNPPVFEAVIGIEFVPVTMGIMRLAAIAALWEETYPIVQENPALPPSVAQGQQEFRFDLAPSGAPVRLWMATESGEYLIQVQNDRLLLNWRKRGNGVYPRFEVVRDRFSRVVDDFFAYLASVGEPPVNVIGTEFTYFNRIEGDLPASDVVTIFSSSNVVLPGEPLIATYQEVRNLQDMVSGDRGQLSISTEPAVDSQGARGLHMTITTKFFSDGVESRKQLDQLLTSGHDVSRSAFDALVTERVQKEWS